MCLSAKYCPKEWCEIEGFTDPRPVGTVAVCSYCIDHDLNDTDFPVGPIDLIAESPVSATENVLRTDCFVVTAVTDHFAEIWGHKIGAMFHC